MFCIVSEIKWHVQNEQAHNLCEHIVGIFSPTSYKFGTCITYTKALQKY